MKLDLLRAFCETDATIAFTAVASTAAGLLPASGVVKNNSLYTPNACFAFALLPQSNDISQRL